MKPTYPDDFDWFCLSLGLVLGASRRGDIRDYLMARGATEAEMDDLVGAGLKVAQALYRKESS